MPQHLSMPAAGPSFYARVFHPAFNLDAEDAEDAVDRFDAHTRAVGMGVQGLRNIFGRVREARVGASLWLISTHLVLTLVNVRDVQGRKTALLLSPLLDHIEAISICTDDRDKRRY